MRFKELESEKLVLEEEMRKLKESDEDSLVEQMMVNKALEVEKQVAENKAEEWKIKFEKLAEAVRKLDELGAFRVGELELDEDVKVGLELAGVGKKKIESLCREGLVNHQVSGCSPCVTTPVKDCSMSGRNRDDVSSRRRVNKMLVFEGDGGKSTDVVDLSDSETEERIDREEECEDEDVGACEVDTNTGRKRKRVITSDSENDDDDDNIPIATLKNLKPPPQNHDSPSTGENVSGGMRKQRRVSSRLRKQKEISTSSECNPTERLVGIPTTGNAHDDDDTEEESEQESESDSLNGFIVDDETASEEGAEGTVPEEEGSDGETGYADVIARLRRDKKPGEHKWNLEGEMLAAFGKDPELCMRAVCVLYRFQTEGENRIKSKVQSYLLAHHSEFSDLFSTCQDAVSKTRLISDDVSDVVQLVSDRPIDVEIREVVDEIREKTKEVRVKRESLGLVSAVVGVCEALRETKEALKCGGFGFAAERIREIKVVLRVGEEEEGEPVAYVLLRREWSDCFDEIQEVLAKFVETAVRFELDSRELRISYQLSVGETNGIALRTVLEAMEVIGMLDYGLAKAADSIFKHVITPAVTHSSTFFAVEDSCKTSGEVAEATLNLEQSLDHKTEDVDGDAIYSGVLTVVKFVCSSLCFGNVTWIHSFGRLTWPRLSELIISKFLSKVVPEDASKFADFQKVIERTSQFETALKELSFVSPSDSEGRLSKYAENVEVHFASRKKIEILAKARSLMLQCNFTIPQGLATSLKSDGADESLDANSSKHIVRLLFSSEMCVVSEAASQLVHLVHKTLEDVCLSSARVGLEFYHAARDSILLYEAVVPVKLGKQISGINQAAVLLHNDCLYLFEEILGLAFEYRASFPSSIKEYAVFADIAPRFKLMAEEVLQRQVQLVISSLQEAIDSADGFQDTHQIKQFESAKFSVEQVVFSLEKVHLIWKPVLLPKTHKQSMRMVLESVFRRITRDILLLDDMAADETFQLQRLIHLMLENLSSLLGSLKSADDTSRPLDDLIPSLRKTRKLAELLDMPLKSITSAWESGELFSCNYTRTEVQDFIKAIFTDSPLRKECLWRIEDVS